MNFYKISEEQFNKDISNELCCYEDIKLPKRGTIMSAGYDFFSPWKFTLQPGESILIPTGVKFCCDWDKWLMIVPRSGQGFKYGIRLANSVGVIDADYFQNEKNEGHIWVKIDYPISSINTNPWTVEKGEAFCQGIIASYYRVADDDVNKIREGGFGSTSNS